MSEQPGPSYMTEAPNPANRTEAPADPDWARYSRQILCEHVGEAGQKKLGGSRVTLIGCGGLGTVLADTLVRAGVGFLRIIDRDYVELNNLQRQVLFSEEDAAEGTPKAIAAATQLAKINSRAVVEPIVAHVDPDNIESFTVGANIILDATDNFEIRFLINDAAVKQGIPWVYGACVGADGMVMPVIPRKTPCLRCVWGEVPPAGISPTCDTVGILAPVVHVVASLQAVDALKILTGRIDAVDGGLLQVNLWTGQFNRYDLQSAMDAGDCPCCKLGRFEYLSGDRTGRADALCGRGAVQISPSTHGNVDFAAIAARVGPLAKERPRINRYLLRFAVEDHEITLFRDGRAIIKGTDDLMVARSVYARYIGT
jgi:adenylyltransferase/sulfurtransferase